MRLPLRAAARYAGHMPASDEWTEWHLTPRGWERGSQQRDFESPRTKEGPRPGDAVLTVKYSDYWASMSRPGEAGTEEIWRSSNEALVAELLAKHGKCPKRL